MQFPALSNGTSTTFTLPAANAASSATVTFAEALPSGVAAPQAHAMAAAPASLGLGTVSVLAAVELQVTQTVAISQSPAFSFTFAQAPSTNTYIAYFNENNIAAGWNLLLGPGKVSGTTVSFASKTLVPPLTLVAGDTYVFALITASSTATPPPASVTFTGTKTEKFSYNYAFVYPTPSSGMPTPPPDTTLTSAVTENISVGSSPFPSSTAPGIVDQHVDETDASNLSSSTFATDQWVGIDTSTSTYKALLYGTAQTQTSSANTPTFATTYTTPQILDEFPEASGLTWQNSPASTTAYSFANGDTGNRVVAADGTYVDTENILSANAQIVTTVNADASASIVGPFYGGYFTSIAMSAPSPQPSASPAINITLTKYDNTTQVIPDGVWYTTPAMFYSENDGITANAAIASSCGTSFGATANDVKRSISALDTALGFVETTTFDTYTVGGVPVCMVTSDVMNFAYDLESQTPYTIFISPQVGLETTTTTETLMLQAAAPSTTAAAARSAATTSVAPAQIAALQAHQLAAFARARFVRTHDLIEHLRSMRNGGIR